MTLEEPAPEPLALPPDLVAAVCSALGLWGGRRLSDADANRAFPAQRRAQVKDLRWA